MFELSDAKNTRTPVVEQDPPNTGPLLEFGVSETIPDSVSTWGSLVSSREWVAPSLKWVLMPTRFRAVVVHPHILKAFETLSAARVAHQLFVRSFARLDTVCS